LIINLGISLTNELFFTSIMRLLDFIFLVNGLSLELLHADLVLTNLLIFVVNLLLKHASDLRFLIIVLFDLVPCDAGICKQLFKSVGALLQADVV